MDQLLSLAALIVCAVVLLSLYNRRFPWKKPGKPWTAAPPSPW